MSSTQLVFLITGSSSGLGLSLAQAVLAAGHKVIATMRRPEANTEILEKIESTANGKVVQLDVTDVALESKTSTLLNVFDRIDVLVNNAGYGYGGPLDDADIAESRRLKETLFWGPYRLTKALLPHMRARGTGTIINVTSTEGISSAPSLSIYAACKFALEGMSEALHGEVASFGIRVLIAEPGGMHTAFLPEQNVAVGHFGKAYEGTPAEHVMQMLRSQHGGQVLDPDRTAGRIVEAMIGGGEGWPIRRETWLRLPLGKEMLGRAEGKMQAIKENMDAMRTVGISCDFDE